MKLLKLLCAIFLYAAITSCGKTDPVNPVKPIKPDTTVTPTSTADVYLAGIVNDKATLWKNGVATTLSASNAITAAYSVFVNGADVFVAGYGTDANNGNGVALLWKNGVASILPSPNPGARAESVYVSAGGGVYVAGNSTVLYQNNQDYPNNGIFSYTAATLWANGSPTILSDGNKIFFDSNAILRVNTNRDSHALGVYGDGANVYVSGDEDYGNYGQINPVLWKNGKKLVLYNPIGGDYTSNKPVDGFLGKFFTGDTTYVIPPTFSLMSVNEATSVFASSSGVYVAGYVTQGAFNGGIQLNTPHRATIWKNGIDASIGDSKQSANPNGIYVSGNDVYAVGYTTPGGKETPTVWKNGAASLLPYTGQGAVARSVFVLGSDVYVAGTEVVDAAAGTYRGVMWKNGVPTEFSDAANRTFVTSVFVKAK